MNLLLDLKYLEDEWTSLPPNKHGYDINIDQYEEDGIIRILAYPIRYNWFKRTMETDFTRSYMLARIDTRR